QRQRDGGDQGGGGHGGQRQRPRRAVGDLGPQQEPAGGGHRDQRDRQDRAAGLGPHLASGLEAQEHRAVQGEQRQRGEPAEQRVRVEQVEQAGGDDVVGVHGHAAHDVGEG